MPAFEADDAVTLAVLLARELDAGVGAALAISDGVLVLDHVVARVGRSESGAGAWEGEVVLRPGQRTAAPGGSAGPGVPSLPAAVAALPVLRVEGVGPRWAKALVRAGLTDVGALAGAGADLLHELVEATGSRLPLAFAARARACAVALDEVPAALTQLSMREVLAVPPVRTHRRTGAPLVACVTVWDAASRLAGQLDDVVLDLPVRALSR